MDKLKEALEVIAKHNGLGKVSDDLLIKACDNYKINSESFDDSYEYHIVVAKSLYDHINKIEPDSEICKAILPGQTKVVDGVTYVYTYTPNAKTLYDWRVLSGAGGRPVATANVDSKQKYINDLFPTDLSSLKVIKKLGGSTGAELVEDSLGNQYVMKKGTNTSNEHVKSEYLTNQIYDMLGQRVPDFELYEENGNAVMLSKFIPMTSVPSANDYGEMAKGFAVDALLANWDIYQNDNCLKDSAGRIIRVDNGGAMAYRAQGSSKTFGSKLPDWDSMQKYNPSVVSSLTPQDYIDQIDAVLAKRQNVVDYLHSSGEHSLASTFDGRFDDMERIKKDYETALAKKNKKIVPRKLLADADMYRDFDETELADFWSQTNGSDYYSKIFNKDNEGWELLGKVCKSRGFDARPDVVDDKDYWAAVAANKYQIFRGIAPDRRSAEDFADDFKLNDNCFWGSIGIYGAGIYFHVNDGNDKSNDKSTYKNSNAYKHARSYSGSNGAIIECVMHPDSKVAKVVDLKKEILNMVTYDKSLAKAKQDEFDQLLSVLTTQESDLRNITQKTTDEIKDKMNWDNDVLVMSQIEIDSIDWGALNDKGEPDYPSFDNFFHGKMADWVTKNGGTVKEKVPGSEVYILRLPNSKQEFMFSRYQYENNAIKRKNAFSVAYSYPVKRFQNWLMTNHYGVINKVIEKEMVNIGTKVTDLQADIKVTKSDMRQVENELSDLKKTKNPNGDIMSGIYESVRGGNKEAIGVYAAIKGYDALIEPNGNGDSNSFMIVLNRSKVIIKK